MPLTADAARKNDRRSGNEDQRDNSGKDDQRGGGGEKSDKDKNADAKVEDQATEAKAEKQGGREEAEKQDAGNEEYQGGETEKSGERNRNENRGGDEGGGGKAEDDGARREARRQETTAESDEPSRDRDDVDHSDGDRRDRVQEFEQAADEVPVDVGLAQTTVAPTNPNIVIPDIPETTAVDLVVEANPDVIAMVSARGGFAFARSGNVTAFTGPDGATIIQTGTESPTTAPVPVEPSDDGGNNDLDFTS